MRHPPVPARLRGRRKFLLTGSAAAAGIGVGAATVLESRHNGLARWIDGLLRRHLPGFRMDPDSVERLIATIDGHNLLRSDMGRWAASFDAQAPWLVARVPGAAVALDRAERMVLTELLLGCNFFESSAPDALLVYQPSPPACRNPFARFHDAASAGLV